MRVWGDEPQDARELAARMGIEHYVADERIPFKETIVKNFIDEYKQGRTPNPCVMCNPLFKFPKPFCDRCCLEDFCAKAYFERIKGVRIIS